MEHEFVKGMVSVIVPCYNVAPYIKRCLNSILNNTFSDFEIICVNDGSTDDTLEELRCFQHDDRVSIIQQENQGLSAARNVGISVARGEFITYIDSDDWIHKDFLQRLVDAQKLTDADVVMCDYMRVEGMVSDEEMITPVDPVVYDALGVWNNTSFKNYVWRKLYKRSYILGFLFLKGLKIAEDMLYNMEMFVGNPDAKYAVINDKLLYYYNRPGSLIRSFSGGDLMPVVKGLSESISRCNSNLITVPAIETIKFGLAARYLSMFEPNYEDVKLTCSSYFSLALKSVKGNISKREYFKYSQFVRFPFLYRGFRLLTDRTMLDWEKNQKAKRSKK